LPALIVSFYLATHLLTEDGNRKSMAYASIAGLPVQAGLYVAPLRTTCAPG
jgi:hypothetical protein